MPESSEPKGVRSSLRALQRATTQSTRDDRVIDAVARRLGPTKSFLDVGSSDGRIASVIAERVGATDARGVDILVQPNARIPVETYDGVNIPFDDASFDAVTIIDVLHHAQDQTAVLSEALRVVRPGGVVVIKDHLRTGFVGRNALHAADIASNFAVGIRSPGYYLSFNEWSDLIERAGGRIRFVEWPMRIHDFPWTLIVRPSFHLLFGVEHRS